MTIPKTIEIKSDNNKLEFVEEKKGTYYYRYTRSIEKLNTLIGFSEIELTKLIKVNT